MPLDDKTRWNEKYTQGSHSWETPDDFLAQAYEKFLEGAEPGRALDIAGGAGRHSLWLAQRGWQVTLLDVSDVGVALAQKKARAAGVAIDARVADLHADAADLGGPYDLIVVFFFLHRPLFPAILKSLKPGGHLIYKTYTIDQLQFDKGPRDAEFLLQHGELQKAFEGVDMLHYREEIAEEKAVVEMAARQG
ncbi:MAG: methyltransferase domain-containing protein [Acidobacteriia bacterium]|nr:methyltransferase domain-containing protein [Terriglobia bacterium]